MSTILITGANKGIGLEIVKQHIGRGDDVIAVCRKPSDALSETGAKIISGVEFLDKNFETVLLEQLQVSTIDRVVANAGIRGFDNFEDFDADAIREQFEVNAVAPLRLLKAIDHLLPNKAKIVLISTRVASHEDNAGGGEYGYRMSKSALNMAGINLSISLREREIAVFMLHPGYVRTDLTLGEGLINADDSAVNLVRIADKLELKDSGTFWHSIEGNELPW